MQRQPFCGMGKSAFGPGIKAGGTNYVVQLMNVRDRETTPARASTTPLPPELENLKQRLLERIASGDPLAPDFGRAIQAISSYVQAYETEFSLEHDAVCVLGQDNILRYLPLNDLRIRIHPDDTPFEILARICAAYIAGCRMTVSVTPTHNSEFVAWLDRQTETWGAGIEFVEESIEELIEVIRLRHIDRVRYAAPGRAATDLLKAVGDSGIYIAQAPVLCEGRVELLWYLNEQAISVDYHRYGNLGERADEKRRSVL